MMENEIRRASPESQYGNSGAVPEDTPDMFWLRMQDDYDSRVRLGGMLAGQYRYREAVEAYRLAERIRRDDPMLYLRLGGALLTLFRFDEAMEAYRRTLSLGMPEKKAAFYFGAWYYLTGSYGEAAEQFRKVLPADGENTVSAIYWHTLASRKTGAAPDLLAGLRPDMDPGHHAAYRRALCAFTGEADPGALLSEARDGRSDLDAAILSYGLAVLYETSGDPVRARECLALTLSRESVWPCVASLAAWRETKALPL